MSTSRLEKFIYAICSMEVSDLPAPISRIEILWNCLITGETPDFEPQSRNEQYLMAMLGLYELENLPAPMSRGEKLLYKIAMGETDLSDVPGYLSRYEELLGYLAENGGVGDFEYILQTLNQRLSTLYSTKERPVKSAILTGQTLVNLFQDMDYVWNNLTKQDSFNYNGDLIILNNGYRDGRYWNLVPKIPNIKSNTEYTMIFTKGSSPYVEFGTVDENGQTSALKRFTNAQKVKITSPNNGDLRVKFCIENPTSDKSAINLGKVMFIEGDYTNVDIPYFEGMQSVKMPVLTTTGKNLFYGKLENGNFNGGTNNLRSSMFELKELTKYTISNDMGYSANITFHDKNDKYISEISSSQSRFAFETPLRTKYVWIRTWSNQCDLNVKFQIEEGSAATSYEPFKSNILTVNEEVELCGIGGVQDTLDLVTGELTQRIGDIVLDETLDYQGSSSANGENTMYFQFDLGAYPSSTPISHYFKVSSANLYVSDNDYEAIRITSSGALQLRILKSKLPTTDIDGAKEFFKQNNISIQYQLAQESIKTVDLITVDQDGQPTQLKTFNDITHVELSSEGLIPEVELEVATKINETLLTMSPQHHDISETQNKLGQTIDEQTENTDAAMLATTEIYEQTL